MVDKSFEVWVLYEVFESYSDDIVVLENKQRSAVFIDVNLLLLFFLTHAFDRSSSKSFQMNMVNWHNLILFKFINSTVLTLVSIVLLVFHILRVFLPVSS